MSIYFASQLGRALLVVAGLVPAGTQGAESVENPSIWVVLVVARLPAIPGQVLRGSPVFFETVGLSLEPTPSIALVYGVT